MTQTPMEEQLWLNYNSTKAHIDNIKYWLIVNILCYLVHTWSNLAFAVGFVSCFIVDSSIMIVIFYSFEKHELYSKRSIL